MLKKTVSVLLAIILICAAVPFCAVSASAAESGDVTGDNKITIADVTAIQRYLADIENINNIGQRI